MQCPEDHFGKHLADPRNARQFLDPRLFHTLQATKVVQQGTTPARTYSWDFFQARSRGGFLTPSPVPGNREPVSLVPDLLNQVRGR